ncbi:hypothetical protein, partial [Streptomyces hesseae]
MTLHDYHALCDRATLSTPGGEICERGVREACGSCLERYPLNVPLPGDAPLRGDAPSPGHAPRSAEGLRHEGDLRATYDARAHERREAFMQHFRAVVRFLAPSHFLAAIYADSGLVTRNAIDVLPYGHPGDVFEPRRSVSGRALRVG